MEVKEPITEQRAMGQPTLEIVGRFTYYFHHSVYDILGNPTHKRHDTNPALSSGWD